MLTLEEERKSLEALRGEQAAKASEMGVELAEREAQIEELGKRISSVEHLNAKEREGLVAKLSQEKEDAIIRLRSELEERIAELEVEKTEAV